MQRFHRIDSGMPNNVAAHLTHAYFVEEELGFYTSNTHPSTLSLSQDRPDFSMNTLEMDALPLLQHSCLLYAKERAHKTNGV